jgi:protein-S-isoprenylcysteine O-methyltransferase Ste14
MKKRLKINGIIMFVAFVLTAIFHKFIIRHQAGGYLDNTAEVVGLSLILMGQLIRVSARGYKSEHSAESKKLIDGGPYSLIRNPMYLGIVCIGLGVVSMLFEWWAILVFSVVFIRRYIRLIFKEENKLKNIFKDEYVQYCKKVPERLFPSPLKMLRMDIVDYLPVKASWFWREIGSILWLLFGVFLLESWEDLLYEGMAAYLPELLRLIGVLALFICLAFYLNQGTKRPRNNA